MSRTLSPTPLGQVRVTVESSSGAAETLPLLSQAFRPFYICAGLVAVVAVPVWLAVFLGALPWQPSAALAPMAWHAHEMIYGFAGAVVVGFLFTAGERWTGLAMPRGALLAGFVALWIAGRATALLGPVQVHAFLDTLLLPSVAGVLAVRLLQTGQLRNLVVVAILAGLTLANVVHHMGVMGLLRESTMQPLRAALALLVLLETVIAGRVIGAFHMAVCRGLVIPPVPWLDRAVGLSTVAALVAWIALPGPVVAPVACAVAAVLHAVRLVWWQPWAGRRFPMLWILSLAYAFIPAGLGLLAIALATADDPAPRVTVAVAEHAFAAGATGGLVLGMMCRSARGHTGRMIHASRVEAVAMAMVLVGAAVRVGWPCVLPGEPTAGLVLAASLWCGAFAIFLAKFTPWLLGPPARR